MSNKVIMITGCSTGVGAALAVRLAASGDVVYATMRNLEKSTGLKAAAAARGVKLHLLPLDVQRMETIEAAVLHIVEEQGHIDVLVNNAGAGFVRGTEQVTEAEVQGVLDVNFLGVVRCTKAVLPKMRERGRGHIVNVTSVGGLVGQPMNEFYCAAKFAVEGYTESLATYMEPFFGIKFSIVEPGGIQTEFAATVHKQLGESGGIRNDPYKVVMDSYLGRLQSRPPEYVARLYQTAEQVAEVIERVVKAEHPPLRVRTSEWAEEFCAFKTAADPDGLKQTQRVREELLLKHTK